jgi:Na+/H+ antiporter NhaD/arsenite permease-like protein
MLVTIIIVFLIGYLLITFEHPLKVNKAGTALLTGTLLWVMYIYVAPACISALPDEAFRFFLARNPQFVLLPFEEQCIHFVVEHQVPECVGNLAGTLLFLVGAMVTVELVDIHGGFLFITDHITTRNKRKLLVLIAFLSFFMSSVLDNLTASIVMVMLIRKLIGEVREQWIFGSIIVIAANSGGAWSPIGDVTTVMLWVHGNITAGETVPNLFLPSIVSILVPLFIMLPSLHGEVTSPCQAACEENKLLKELKTRERLSILMLGMFCLLFVPVFKTVTHLPPFMGMLLGVSVLWIYTEIMYRQKTRVEEEMKWRISKVIRRIDWPTLLFFLGILLAVDVLRYSGILGYLANWLDTAVGNVYVVDLIIGTVSAMVDNVPLVAGAIGMYPVASEMMVSAAADPVYMANFLPDGVFWQFLAYCAGVGGSILLLGSAAGVVTMGLVKIRFFWYLRRITWMAIAGYLAGATVYYLQNSISGLF